VPIGYAGWYTGKIIATNGDILRKGDLIVIYKFEREFLVEHGYVKGKSYYNNALIDTNRVNRNSLSMLNSYIQDQLNNCINIKKYSNLEDTLILFKYEFSINDSGKVQDIVSQNENVKNYALLNESIMNCFYGLPYFEIIQKRNVPITEYFYITVKVNINSYELSTILQWSMWNEFKTRPPLKKN
jgi:hypothetical protein